MASVAENELLDYESDPEDANLSLTMRRREASDDDQEEEEKESLRQRVDSRVSDSVSEGAAAEYDGDEFDQFDDDEEAEVEDEEEVRIESNVKVVGAELDVDGNELEFPGAVEGRKEVIDGGDYVEDGEGGENGVEKDKKENQPFVVPTAGAFYMHDDRFRESGGPGRGGGGRHRYYFWLLLRF